MSKDENPETTFRRLRCSFATHSKHDGLDCLQTHILLVQVMTENPEGILRRHIDLIAQEASSERVRVTAHDVRQALFDLQERGVIKWWPELHCVWWIECADEQTKHAVRPKIAWKSIANRLVKLRAPIRASFFARYGENLPDTMAPDAVSQNRPESNGGQIGMFSQQNKNENENKNENKTNVAAGSFRPAGPEMAISTEPTDGPPAATAPNAGGSIPGDSRVPSPHADAPTTDDENRGDEPSGCPARFTDRFYRAILDRVTECMRELNPKSRGPRLNDANRKLIKSASKREDASLDDWMHTIDVQFADLKRQNNPSKNRFMLLKHLAAPHPWRMAESADERGAAPVSRRHHGHFFSGEKTGGFGRENGPSPERVKEYCDRGGDGPIDFFDLEAGGEPAPASPFDFPERAGQDTDNVH